MKRTILIIIIICCTFLTELSGQNTQTYKSNKVDIASYPLETIFVHQNTSMLFSGEYLYYKVYCLERASSKYSSLSKIAYVELIGEDLTEVFRHKIVLEKGRGQGDFFIPSNIPSGNYKLIAYTQWMTNFEVDSFYQSDISILNPYLGNQKRIVSDTIKATNNPDSNNLEDNSTVQAPITRDDNTFKLFVDKKKYGRREAVRLKFRNFIRERGFGSYSLSVRKIDELPRHSTLSSNDYLQTIIKNPQLTKGSHLVSMPESRGAIVSGKVLRRNTGTVASGKDVGLSISGKDFFFKVVTTDSQGNFSFALNSYYEKESGRIEVIDSESSAYRIVVDETLPIDYSNIKFNAFKVTPSMKETITNRSINNQIENGYFSIKPDTIGLLMTEKPFTHYESKLTYDLDQYTRFSTVDEVFTEIVKLVWTEKDENDQLVVKVFNRRFEKSSDDLPLIFIDGVFVQNHKDLLEYNALKIKSITVLRNQYQFGNKDYQGVVSVESILGNFDEEYSRESVEELKIFASEQPKIYFKQRYNLGSKSNRIPDYRAQLLWEPSIEMNRSELSFMFYTSDNPGYYEISLEGFTNNGRPVSLKEYITVSD